MARNVIDLFSEDDEKRRSSLPLEQPAVQKEQDEQGEAVPVDSAVFVSVEESKEIKESKEQLPL